jgi:hypothetical protein
MAEHIQNGGCNSVKPGKFIGTANNIASIDIIVNDIFIIDNNIIDVFVNDDYITAQQSPITY